MSGLDRASGSGNGGDQESGNRGFRGSGDQGNQFYVAVIDRLSSDECVYICTYTEYLCESAPHNEDNDSCWLSLTIWWRIRCWSYYAETEVGAVKSDRKLMISVTLGGIWLWRDSKEMRRVLHGISKSKGNLRTLIDNGIIHSSKTNISLTVRLSQAEISNQIQIGLINRIKWCYWPNKLIYLKKTYKLYLQFYKICSINFWAF